MSADLHGEALPSREFASGEFFRDVVRGLSHPQKALPSRYLYDARGSQLFEQITALPEYYPTRTEIELLRSHGEQIARAVPPRTAVVEFGSGSSRKTELLLEALKEPIAYIPIEISSAALYPAAERIARRFPDIDVHPVLGGFHCLHELRLPALGVGCLGFFPGSTIGNMDTGEAIAFLRAARTLLGARALMLIGADLMKPLDILIPAYNDASGVTAEFNLNILVRINRELESNFDLDGFEHEAIYNGQESRIEMHLRSKRAQAVRVGERAFTFREGETIHTENSHKYDAAGFSRLAALSGWRTNKTWIDSRRLFSLHLLR